MLRKLARKDFDKVFGLIEKSFPKDEYRTYDGQKILLEDPAYEIYGLPGADESIMAFMAVWQFKPFVFLEHFAVAPEHRNGGIGSQLLGELIRSAGKMVCLEAELPDNIIASRRIGFYERNGFFRNDYPYIQPSLSPGQNPVPLVIMSSGRPLSRAEFAEIQQVLYIRVYKSAQNQ